MDEEVTLNDNPITKEQLEETKNNLPNNERIVEVEDGKFRKLTRMTD